MTDQNSRSAIGGQSSLGAQQQGNITYGVMPEQVLKEFQTASQSSPGTNFIVVQRVRQGETPKVWSTGDQTETQQLFRAAYDMLAEPATSR